MPITLQEMSSAVILVVDDDQTSLLTTQKVLEKSGYQVLTAANGREAVSIFMDHKPDLIIMDVMMPVMDGFDATTAIRSYATDKAIPILMLTSQDDLESIHHAFDAGATDFLIKPINWTLLGERIRYSLKSSMVEDKLRRTQAQLMYAQKLAKLGYWEWDVKADRVTGSAAAFEIFGIPNQADVTLDQFIANVAPKDVPLIQQTITDANQGYQDIQVSFRIIHRDQSVAHIDCLAEAEYIDDELVKLKGSVQDITRLHKAETLIDYQSNHDVLTDLPNRSFFNRRISHFLESRNYQTLSAVVILDIDRFKKINDTLGQENGDALLRNVALRLKRVTREEDDVARLGSDEFAILIRYAKDVSELHLSVNRIFQDLSKVFVINGQEHFITYSMGVCVVENSEDESANELIANANVARTEAKTAGGNQAIFYQSDMNAEARTQLMLENDLRKALERNEIEVYYQPQVDAKTLEIMGAEALARWRHPTEGYISPGIFIPLAESTGLIVEIGRYVLKTAVKDAEKWQAAGFECVHVGINLSGRQFTHSNLMKDIQGILQETSLSASCIDLEITESLAMSNADQNISILKGLKAMGVSLSIDDFGTGYSSLAYLQSFPIDTIKVDRSFVLNLGTNEGQAIVKTILAMAESLQLNVVVEGIEEDFQVEFLQGKHCQIFQGFKFGKPMDSEAFFKLLTSKK